MPIDEIRRRVEYIKNMAADPEAAHSAEDRLRADFIEYVRHIGYDPNLADKARLVLSTDQIDFARWCA